MQQFATSPLDARPLELVSTALRDNLQRADETPQDIAAILYAALRRDGRPDSQIESLLDLAPLDLPLRVESYAPQTSGRVRLRPPGPVTAIHVDASSAVWVVRCTNALLMIDRNDVPTTIGTSRLTASALSPDGTIAITGDAEGTVAFWAVPDGALLGRYAAHQGEVTHVVFTKSGPYSCGADGTVLQWGVRDAGWFIEDRRTVGRVTSAATLPHELLLGCASGDIVEITHLAAPVHPKAHDGPVTGLACDELAVYSAGADRTLRVSPRTSGTGNPVVVQTGHTLGIAGLIAEPAAGLLVTWAADRTARMWHVVRTPGLSVTAGRVFDHEAAVTAATIVRDFPRGTPRNPEGPRGTESLVTGSADGSLYVWSFQGGFRQQLRHGGAIRACAVRNEELITGGDDRELVRSSFELVANPDAGVSDVSSVPNAIGICRGGTFDVRYDGGAGGVGGPTGTSIALRGDGRRALVWRRGEKQLSEWDVQRSKEQRIGGFNAGVAFAGYAGELIAVALEDGQVQFARGTRPLERSRDAPTLAKELETWSRSLSVRTITAMAAMHDVVITAYIDGTLVRWRPGPPESAMLGQHTSRVTALAAGSTFVVSGTADGEIALWKVWGGTAPQFRARHGRRILHVAWSSRPAVVSAADDHTVAVWSDKGEQLATCSGHRDRITALLVDDRSQLIFTASLDRTVRAWDFHGRQQGIVYGDHPFSVLALVHGGIMPGEILAGDDAGALWTFGFRGDTGVDSAGLEGIFPPPPTPRRLKKTPPPKQGKKAAGKKPARKSFSSSSSSKKSSKKK